MINVAVSLSEVSHFSYDATLIQPSHQSINHNKWVNSKWRREVVQEPSRGSHLHGIIPSARTRKQTEVAPMSQVCLNPRQSHVCNTEAVTWVGWVVLNDQRCQIQHLDRVTPTWRTLYYLLHGTFYSRRNKAISVQRPDVYADWHLLKLLLCGWNR